MSGQLVQDCRESGSTARGERYAIPRVEETIQPSAPVITEPGPITPQVITQLVPQQAADEPELLSRIHTWVTNEARCWVRI